MLRYVLLESPNKSGSVWGVSPLRTHCHNSHPLADPPPRTPLPGPSNWLETCSRTLQDPLTGTAPGRRPKAAAQVGCRTAGLVVFSSEFRANLRVPGGGSEGRRADGKMEKNIESDHLDGKSAAKSTKKFRQPPTRAPYVVRFKFFNVHSARSGLPSELPPYQPP